jgi:hypothetical protein
MSLGAELKELVNGWKRTAGENDSDAFIIAFAIAALIEEVSDGNAQLRRIADLLDEARKEVSGTRP